MIACGHLYTGVFEAGGGERIDCCTFPVRHTDSFIPQRSDSAEMHHMRQIMWGFFLSKVSKPVLLEPTNQLWTWTLASRDLFNCRKCFCLAHHHQLLSPPWQPDEWHYSSLCSCSSSLTPLFFSFFFWYLLIYIWRGFSSSVFLSACERRAGGDMCAQVTAQVRNKCKEAASPLLSEIKHK